MSRTVVRPLILVVLATLLVTAGLAGSAAAVEHEEDETEDGPSIDPGYDETLSFGDVVSSEFAGSSAAAATQDRKAFLQAKKAFHTARQDIQAIKKGDESPVEDVPAFFDSDDDDD